MASLQDQRDNSHNRRRRSRSPRRDDGRHDVRSARSRSPRRRHHHHHHHHHRSRPSPPSDIRLPFQSGSLHKRDFPNFHNLFAEYLDVQKRLAIEELSDDEVRGRWKSFVGRWNRGELAEGWYDPDTKTRIDERAAAELAHPTSSLSAARPLEESPHVRDVTPPAPADTTVDRARDRDGDDDEDDEEENYGPALPSAATRHLGPGVPSLQDLQQRDELAEEDRSAARADARFARELDRKAADERLAELVPRADPGSRERQLEKKRATAEVTRGFREAKSPGAQEVGERDLMGGGDEDGVDAYKSKLKAREKVKNEREIRKEEVLRARAAEREERMAEHRRKEEKTMDMLKAMARQRFG